MIDNSPAEPDVTFFTCANHAYQDFAPLYAAAVLSHVPNARVEVGVQNARAFKAANATGMRVLEDAFGKDRFLIRSVPWKRFDRRIPPGAVRFLEQPELRSPYVYIGDIDIIIFDNTLVQQHLAFMKRTGLPYSNSVRPGTTRMSGLHFTEYDAHYPLPNLDDFTVVQDEMLLYEICLRKGVGIQDSEWFRPTHGIHVSPNREPLGHIKNGRRRPGWGNLKRYAAAYWALTESAFMTELRPLLSERINAVLAKLEAHLPAREA